MSEKLNRAFVKATHPNTFDADFAIILSGEKNWQGMDDSPKGNSQMNNEPMSILLTIPSPKYQVRDGVHRKKENFKCDVERIEYDLQIMPGGTGSVFEDEIIRWVEVLR